MARYAKNENSDLRYVRRHLLVGWWSLFFFGLGGLVLEALHGFKVPAYLDVSNEPRRLMWTLAHAHGTLLSVLNLIFALSIRLIPEFAVVRRGMISGVLVAATFLLPGGFLVGGVLVYGGDPWLGAFLVPVGAVLLLVAVFQLAQAAKQLSIDPGGPSALSNKDRK